MRNSKKLKDCMIRVAAVVTAFTLTFSVCDGINRMESGKVKAITPEVVSLDSGNITVYRAIQSALIEFNSVTDASEYKIYRKNGGKSSKKKYIYIGKVLESDYAKIDLNYRQFADYTMSKKKKYSTKLNYTYKVVAYKKVDGKNVKITSSTKYSKKHKPGKVEFGYDAWAYTNMIRKEKKRNEKIYLWNHFLEQGAIVRAKEMENAPKRKNGKIDHHVRPDGTGFRSAFGYGYTKLSCGRIYSGICADENIGIGLENLDWLGIMNKFMNSDGHAAVVTGLSLDDCNSSNEPIHLAYGDGYYRDLLPGEVERDCLGMCAVTYSKFGYRKAGFIYYDYVVGDVTGVYRTNDKINDNWIGELITTDGYYLGTNVKAKNYKKSMYRGDDNSDYAGYK